MKRQNPVGSFFHRVLFFVWMRLCPGMLLAECILSERCRKSSTVQGVILCATLFAFTEERKQADMVVFSGKAAV